MSPSAVRACPNRSEGSSTKQLVSKPRIVEHSLRHWFRHLKETFVFLKVREQASHAKRTKPAAGVNLLSRLAVSYYWKSKIRLDTSLTNPAHPQVIKVTALLAFFEHLSKSTFVDTTLK
jgi:hypothetical protein